MEISQILSAVDHTLLTPQARWQDIAQACDDAVKYQTAAVCIPPSYVKRAAEYLCDRMRICTVIGFPNGYSTTQSKCFEAVQAVENGASEIDMVINIGNLKDGRYDAVLGEIVRVKEACGENVLKVIIETCLLSEEEKIRMCDIVSRSGADFIKTSTGFSRAGADIMDIRLFRKYLGSSVKIKAAGGIRSISDAEKFLEAGAHRLGTSAVVKLVKNEKQHNY